MWTDFWSFQLSLVLDHGVEVHVEELLARVDDLDESIDTFLTAQD